MKIFDIPQYGPMFRFNDADIYRTLYILSQGRRIGRKRLADTIGVGEGSMRRILEQLRDWEMVDIKQTGITIKRAGLGFLEEVPVKIIEGINFGDMTVGEYTYAVLVRGVASKIENGMQQRDAGIKVGSNGCTTIVFRNGHLSVPPDWNVDENSPEVAKKIRSTTMSADDVIIVGGGPTEQIAANAALTAAFELF